MRITKSEVASIILLTLYPLLHFQDSMRFLLVVLLALGIAIPTEAQLADSLCTYDTCALRYEPQFFGAGLVRGIEGVPVDSGLSSAVAASPRALDYARTYERTRTPAFLAILGSAILAGVAATPPENGIDLPDGVRLGMTAGAIGLSIVGIRLTNRSQRARSRAVWHYNQSLAR